MAASNELHLSQALAAIAEDAVFGLSAIRRADVEVLRALAKRRAPAYEKAAHGGERRGAAAFTDWVFELCSMMAPIHPPEWMPMADVIEAGVSLSGGARGVRALFTNKPSEKDVERVSRLGTFTVRALSAVLGSDGALSEDEQLVRDAFLASLGLPDAHARLLRAEAPMAIEALEIPGDIDAKLVRALVQGAWLAAARDSLDPREERAVLQLANRLRCLTSDTEALRADVLRSLERQRGVGLAAIDALRVMLAEDRDGSRKLVEAALELFLPPAYRAEPLAAFEQNAPVTLARRHDLDREGKALVLSLAWVAALYANPTLTRRVELIALHETIAADLDAGGAGSMARDAIDGFVEAELLGAMSGPSA